jgi:hypothetical protein
MKMKTSISLFISALLMWTGSAQAELSWVQTPFWRALYQNQQTLKIVAQNAKLASECEDADQYRGLDDKQVFDYWRKNSSTMESDFTATFKVDHEATVAMVQQTVAAANQAEQASGSPDPLPFYTLPTGEIIPLNGTVTATINPGPNSLSQRAQTLGLRPLPIQVSVQGAVDATIVVHGRDAVCDLYSGHSTITVNSTGQVKVTIENQLKLLALYHQLEQINVNAHAFGKSPIRRALVVGIELGEIIYPLTHDVSQTVGYIESIVSALFDENMEPNQVWTWVNNAAHLYVNGSVPATFNITLEK